ncbi:MAG: class II aldolase/adducin family protein, partial [Acidobacteriota bacterium]
MTTPAADSLGSQSGNGVADRGEPDRATAKDVARAARIIAGAGLIEAFGHVSARDGEGMLITATRPLATATAADVHRLGPGAQVPHGAEDLPLEAPMHAAVYAARPEVDAICRTH